MVRLTALMYATMSLAIGLGTVFSPQFVLWTLALGAGALCARGSRIRGPALMLLPIAALTQVVFPFQYRHLIVTDGWGLTLLGVRNLMVLASGTLAFAAVLRGTPTDEPGGVRPGS